MDNLIILSILLLVPIFGLWCIERMEEREARRMAEKNWNGRIRRYAVRAGR